MYLMFSLISLLALPPVTGAEGSDDVVTVCESDRHDSPFDSTEAVVSLLAQAMRQVLRDHTIRVREGELRLPERDPMLPPVLLILPRVPFEAGLRH